jgi:hypothetical protein
MEFLSFVRRHEAGRAEAVEALLRYEDALTRCASADRRISPRGDPVPPGATLWWSDMPVRKERVVVLKLSHDIQSIVDALKLRTEPARVRGPHFYVTREVSAGTDRLVQVSDWMARLLRICDGRRSIEEIVRQLSVHLPEVEESLRKYVCMRLLDGAQTEKFIAIYRSARATEDTLDSAGSRSKVSAGDAA